MNPTPCCPSCKKPDQVAKISAIYLEGIRRSRQAKSKGISGLNASADFLPQVYHTMPNAVILDLGKRLKPPESGKSQVLRPIRPDLALIAFSLVAPLFLAQIYQSQPNSILPVLAVLGFFYGIYFWKRKYFISKFDEQQKRQHDAQERIQKAIRRWMDFYYCPCQNGIFLPGMAASIPIYPEIPNFYDPT